jgi:hypothetical protein
MYQYFFEILSKSLITTLWRGLTWCIQGMVLNTSTQFVLLRENWFATGTTPPPPLPFPTVERSRPSPLSVESFWEWTTKTWQRLTILQQCLSNLLGDNLQTASTTLLIFILFSIEYWMVYREPGFLAVVWFGSPLRQLLVPNSQSSCLSQVELTDGKGCVRSQTYDVGKPDSL